MLQGVMAIGLMAAGVALAGSALSARAPEVTAVTRAAADAAAPLWAAVSDPAEDILERRQDDWRHGAAWQGVEERSRAMNRLLDQAVETLSGGQATALRQRIAERRQALAERDATVAELRAGMAALPAERCGGAGADASWMARQVACTFGTSRADQAERIAALRQEMDAIGRDIDADKTAFVDALGAIGIRLTPDQVDGLLRLATADDIVAAHAVYDNLRHVNEELQRATIAADESADVARRYYGFYAVLLEVALHLHERFVETVRTEHLPRLAAIEEEALAARQEAATLRGRERDEILRGQLDANLKALDVTLKAAKLYRDTLEEQARAMTAAWRQVARQRDVAVNTWRTVRASADMLAMMSESGRAFDALLKLDLPAPRPFENLQVEREFERLTEKLVAKR